MPFTEPDDFTFKHINQTDKPDIAAADMKINMDSQAKQLRDYLIDVHIPELETATIPYVVTSGSASTYAVTLSPAPTAYSEGMALAIKIHVTNTGPSTLNVNGLGVRAIRKSNGNHVAATNLKADSIYTVRYNGTNFILQGSDSSGDAIAANVLAGKIFSNNYDTDITGTMINQTGSGLVITPGTADQAIPQGYFNGAQAAGKVLGDPDLVAGNIRAGSEIFNVPGNYTNDATLEAWQLLINQSGYAKGNKITGTMPSKVGSGTVITPRTYDQAVAQGYTDGALGSIKVLGDANLISSKIPRETSIFGINGIFTGIKSIQSINQTISGTSSTKSINQVDPQNSILVYLGAYYSRGAPAGNDNSNLCHITLQSNGNTVLAERSASGMGSAALNYLVIEFNSSSVRTHTQDGSGNGTISELPTTIVSDHYILTSRGHSTTNSGHSYNLDLLSISGNYFDTVLQKRSVKTWTPADDYIIYWNIIELWPDGI